MLVSAFMADKIFADAGLMNDVYGKGFIVNWNSLNHDKLPFPAKKRNRCDEFNNNRGGSSLCH